MSCYEWERGEYKLPQSEWPTFKQRLRTGYNHYVLVNYARAVALRLHLLEAKRGNRNFQLREAAVVHLEVRDGYGKRLPPDSYDIIDAVLKPTNKLQAPRKPRLAHIQTIRYDVASEAAIHLDNRTRIVVWVVPENNHACEFAHEATMGGVFWRALDQVKWTKRTGGQLVGNDEYQQDWYEAGAGGNYVKGVHGCYDKTPHLVNMGESK